MLTVGTKKKGDTHLALEELIIWWKRKAYE